MNIEDGRKGHHVVQLSAPLKLCTQFNCNAVVFNLVGQERPERSGRPNAVEILINSSRRILLPQKYMGDRPRADQKMRNDLIDLLASWSVGWTPDNVQTLGEHCVKIVASALWYLDPHHDRFKDRSLPIPPCFMKFSGYNDWKKKKKKKSSPDFSRWTLTGIFKPFCLSCVNRGHTNPVSRCSTPISQH